jgi:hypothetical protein
MYNVAKPDALPDNTRPSPTPSSTSSGGPGFSWLDRSSTGRRWTCC